MANVSKKKEHGPKQAHRFFNEVTWEFNHGLWMCDDFAQRERARHRTYVDTHVGADDPDAVICGTWMDFVWHQRLLVLLDLRTRYPFDPQRKPWDFRNLTSNVFDTAAYHDGYFVRWWLDQWVMWVGYEVYNHVYDHTRLVQRLTDKECCRLADTELLNWEKRFP